MPDQRSVFAVRVGTLACLTVVAFGTLTPHRAAEQPGACIPQDQCCKICTRGRACGNSCIHATYSCHKGRGCACNADEVCAP